MEADCPKDPNIKTGARDLDTELERINRMAEQQITGRFGIATQNLIYSLFTNLIKGKDHELPPIPVISTGKESDEEEAGVIPLSEQLQKTHPFNRGVLSFDDFNYGTFYLTSDKNILKELLGKQFMRDIRKDYKLSDDKAFAVGEEVKSSKSSVSASGYDSNADNFDD